MLEELCKRIQHCCATLRRSRSKRNVGSCWLKILTCFKLCATTRNNIQQHVTSNNVGSCWPTMLRPFARGLSSKVFEWRASTGSEIFSLLICLGTTKFVLLSVLTLIETICPNVCSKSSVPKAHFQSMCVAQKRRCINYLLLRFTASNPRSDSGRDMRRTWIAGFSAPRCFPRVLRLSLSNTGWFQSSRLRAKLLHAKPKHASGEAGGREKRGRKPEKKKYGSQSRWMR